MPTSRCGRRRLGRRFAGRVFAGGEPRSSDVWPEYVPLLAGAAPVLDLGCGRGELLEALRDAGVEARGVDADPAMVAACRRLGLAADVDDALEALRARSTGSLGGVTAIHIFEHLTAAVWMSVVEAAALGAALRRGARRSSARTRNR